MSDRSTNKKVMHDTKVKGQPETCLPDNKSDDAKRGQKWGGREKGGKQIIWVYTSGDAKKNSCVIGHN